MPLTINLLHEQQFLKQQSKRDPLKLGLYALAGVAALFVAYYGWRLISSTALHLQVKSREAEWAKQEPASNAAAAAEKDVTAQITAAGIVGGRIENRFYWAPLLETLIRNVPANVQVTNLIGNNDMKVDTVMFTLEGVVAGDVPRLAADRFRTALNEGLSKRYKGVTATFRSLEDSLTPVVVNGKSIPTARFNIEVQLTKPSAAPAAAAAPVHHKPS